MKGKSTYTQSEISELRSLIKERIKADRSRQKRIRARMRRIGFYGSYDFGITDLQPVDFEQLISSGRINIKGQNLASKQDEETQAEMVKTPSDMSYNFRMFDPDKHTSEDLPNKPGNYIMCLKNGSSLPDVGVPCEMQTFKDMEVIYTGIAGKSLRKRDYRQHFKGNNAGRSTLRKSLGSLFGYPKIPRDKDPNTGKTKFNEADERRLSEWMQANIILFYASNANPEVLENELISELNPPLNLSKNSNIKNRAFRKNLSSLRSKR